LTINTYLLNIKTIIYSSIDCQADILTAADIQHSFYTSNIETLIP